MRVVRQPVKGVRPEWREFYIRFKLNKGSQGTQLSLMDRLFNACDETAEQFSIYTLNLKPGSKLGSATLKSDTWYEMKLKWNGSKTDSGKCSLSLNGKVVDSLALKNTSPNGISYVHMISTAQTADSGMLVQKVAAKVK